MSADPKGEELAAVIAEIRQRVRVRHPNGVAAGNVPLPDLTPLLHARDAAEAKVASIGTVNPRAGGLKNDLIQKFKRLIARALDWHIREQVEFNRGVMACVQATIESLNECKQALAAVAAQLNQETADLRNEARELRDIRSHWSEWRVGWEQKLAQTEIHFLRSIAELQSAFQHRVTLADANYREQMRSQHDDFERALASQSSELQRQFWEQMARVRTEYDRMIHSELRLLRQRMSVARASESEGQTASSEAVPVSVDWMKFAERFRGSEADIRVRQQMYAARFRDHSPVLDIGCGRGEILQILHDAGIPARGIDSNEDCIALCLSNGLHAEKADLFTYLSGQPDGSLGGIVCCQVIEHLPRPRVPEMIRLAHLKLRDGGLLALETPNPECLAIFATHFYLDPTHQHPIPPALAGFYLEEAGFGRIEIERLSPARDSMPSLSGLPEDFGKEFFGYLDYAVFGIKLA